MKRKHLFTAIIFSLLSLLVACSSTEQKQTEEMKELNNEWMMTLAVQKQKIITKAYKWLKARNVLTDDSLIGFRQAMEKQV